MLQRIQSVWLLLASLFSGITFEFPFYSGDWTKDDVSVSIPLEADLTIPLTIVTILVGLLAFISIFLFRNRKLQLKLGYLGIFLSLALLALYFLEMQHFTRGTIALWSIFSFAILLFYILAVRGIAKDEKLVKSLDRLR